MTVRDAARDRLNVIATRLAVHHGTLIAMSPMRLRHETTETTIDITAGVAVLLLEVMAVVDMAHLQIAMIAAVTALRVVTIVGRLVRDVRVTATTDLLLPSQLLGKGSPTCRFWCWKTLTGKQLRPR